MKISITYQKKKKKIYNTLIGNQKTIINEKIWKSTRCS